MASTAEPLWGDAYGRANREPAFGRARRISSRSSSPLSRVEGRRAGPISQIAPADLVVPIIGQLPPAELTLGEALEACAL
jgi:hypothetical protein